jgi:hypothetical protein
LDRTRHLANFSKEVLMSDNTPVAAAILARSPKTYFALTGSGGVSATDQGSASLALTEAGPITKDADGWQLGARASLTIPHSVAFETDSGELNAWVDSEVAVRLDFRVPNMDNAGGLLSKAAGSRFDGSWWVDVGTDGSITWVNAQQKKQVEVCAPRGTIVADTWYAMVLLFGRRGVQMFIDSNSCEDGFPRPLCWEGWDHRYRGAITTDATSGAVIKGARWVNQFPIRIGDNSWGTATGNVHVRHFAVFVSGGTNVNPWTRTGTRMSQTDINAISGTTPTSPIRSIWHATGNTISVATSDNIHTKFASAVAGDTIVLAAGTHSPTGNLTIPNQVRIVGAGKASTTIAFPSGFSFVSDAATWTNWLSSSPATNLAQGATSWTVSAGHGWQVGDVMVLGTNIKHETDISGGNGKISDAMMRSQMVEIREVGATSISFRQPLYQPFAAANRTHVHRLRPGAKHTYIDNLKVTTDGNAVAFVGVRIAGVVDLRLRNVDFQQLDTGFDRMCMQIYGCLSVEVLDSDFKTEGNDETTGSNVNHPYCCSVSTGGSIVFMNCRADTEGWHDAIDRGFNNLGNEIGTNPSSGPLGALFAGVHVVTVDCQFNVRNTNFFPSQTEVTRQASSGGHEAVDRRDICAKALKGAVVTRWAYGVDYVGLDAGQHYLQFIGGRHVYFHYFRCRNEPSGRDQVYQSGSGDANVDQYVSNVFFTGKGSNKEEKMKGTYTRCHFVNCSTPTP